MFKIAICDDEQKEIDKIYYLIEKNMGSTDMLYKVDCFLNGNKLLESLTRYDLIFLDIQMNDLDGIYIGEQMMCKWDDIWIIYITNYTKYCLQAINKVHAFAYLEKPVDEKEFQKQLVLAIEKNCNKAKTEKVHFEIVLLEHGEVKKIYKEFDIKDIYYFEFINRKIMIQMEKEEYFLYGKLLDIESQLKELGFSRCHNAYVVNMRHIIRIHNYEAILDNNITIPVSQRKSPQFRKKLNDYLHKKI